MFWPFFRKQKPQTAPAVIDSSDRLLEELLFAGTETASGVTINKRTALEVATVLQCVRVLCNGVAQVPFRLLRSGEVPAEDHPLHELLSEEPNEWQTSFDFRTMLVMHLSLTGNAFVWINRHNDEILELLPYPPGTVNIQQEVNGFAMRYFITTANGKQVEVPPRDMWHLKHLPWDYYGGLNIVRTARDVLGLSKATETYGSKLFKNGGRPAGILSTPAVLDEKQREALRQSWAKMNEGLQNANRTAVLWADLKYTPLTSNNDQAQFLETRKFQIEEICRVMGVNPVKVFYSDKNSTYASVEQMNIAHVTNDLMPIYRNIEQSGRRMLLSKAEKAEGYYLKLEAKALMRGAVKERGEFYKTMFNAGALSPNDIRKLEDMPPREGGDEYFVPLNMGKPGEAGQGDGNGNGTQEP